MDVERKEEKEIEEEKEQPQVLKKACCQLRCSPIQRFHEILWPVPVACAALIGPEAAAGAF